MTVIEYGVWLSILLEIKFRNCQTHVEDKKMRTEYLLLE
jgi:hypothetical protein